MGKEKSHGNDEAPELVIGGGGGSPRAMVLLKVRGSQPHALLAGELLQGVGINGPGTLQCAVSYALQKGTHGTSAPCTRTENMARERSLRQEPDTGSQRQISDQCQ